MGEVEFKQKVEDLLDQQAILRDAYEDNVITRDEYAKKMEDRVWAFVRSMIDDDMVSLMREFDYQIILLEEEFIEGSVKWPEYKERKDALIAHYSCMAHLERSLR